MSKERNTTHKWHTGVKFDFGRREPVPKEALAECADNGVRREWFKKAAGRARIGHEARARKRGRGKTERIVECGEHLLERVGQTRIRCELRPVCLRGALWLPGHRRRGRGLIVRAAGLLIKAVPLRRWHLSGPQEVIFDARRHARDVRVEARARQQKCEVGVDALEDSAVEHTVATQSTDVDVFTWVVSDRRAFKAYLLSNNEH